MMVGMLFVYVARNVSVKCDQITPTQSRYSRIVEFLCVKLLMVLGVISSLQLAAPPDLARISLQKCEP